MISEGFGQPQGDLHMYRSRFCKTKLVDVAGIEGGNPNKVSTAVVQSGEVCSYTSKSGLPNPPRS